MDVVDVIVIVYTLLLFIVDLLMPSLMVLFCVWVSVITKEVGMTYKHSTKMNVLAFNHKASCV